MTTIVALFLACAFQQDSKPSTSLVPETPTETAWPINGRATRPNGTVVKVSAVRVERRWEPSLDRFREFTSAESRLMKSAEIDGRAFRANLKAGATGVYEVAVADGEQKLHGERLLLGSPTAQLAVTRKSIARMIEICERASTTLDEIQKVLTGKVPGTPKDKEAFIKRVFADEQLLQELSTKTDLTGSAALLNEICGQIRNAQVWGMGGGRSPEATNDGEGGRDIFLDPKLTFKALHSLIDSVRGVLSRELALSTASMLDALLARAEDRPEKLLQKAKDFASEAARLLTSAPVEDKEARAAIEAVAGADSSGIAETRKSLQAFMLKHRVAPQ